MSERNWNRNELLYLKQRILLDDWKLFFKVLERLSSKIADDYWILSAFQSETK